MLKKRGGDALLPVSFQSRLSAIETWLILTSWIISLILSVTPPAYAQVVPAWETMTLSQRKEATYDLILTYGTEYGLSQAQENQMMGTIRCESNFDPLAWGDDGGSVGLVQIDRLYWPKTTLQDAEDPDYAISFMANLFSQGEANKWTCWRELYGTR